MGRTGGGGAQSEAEQVLACRATLECRRRLHAGTPLSITKLQYFELFCSPVQRATPIGSSDMLLLPPEAASLFALAISPPVAALRPLPALASAELPAPRPSPLTPLPAPTPPSQARRRRGAGVGRAERVQCTVARSRGAGPPHDADAAGAGPGDGSGVASPLPVAPVSPLPAAPVSPLPVAPVPRASGGAEARPILVRAEAVAAAREDEDSEDVGLYETVTGAGGSGASSPQPQPVVSAVLDANGYDEPGFVWPAPTRLDSLHVVAALALLCKGTLRDRASLLYRVFGAEPGVCTILRVRTRILCCLSLRERVSVCVVQTTHTHTHTLV